MKLSQLALLIPLASLAFVSAAPQGFGDEAPGYGGLGEDEYGGAGGVPGLQSEGSGQHRQQKRTGLRRKLSGYAMGKAKNSILNKFGLQTPGQQAETPRFRDVLQDHFGVGGGGNRGATGSFGQPRGQQDDFESEEYPYQ